MLWVAGEPLFRNRLFGAAASSPLALISVAFEAREQESGEGQAPVAAKAGKLKDTAGDGWLNSITLSAGVRAAKQQNRNAARILRISI